MRVDRPVILHHVDAAGLGIGRHELVVEGADLLPPDDIGIAVGDLPRERVEGANDAPLLIIRAGVLGDGHLGGPVHARLWPAVEAHLIQEDQHDLLRVHRRLP